MSTVYNNSPSCLQPSCIVLYMLERRKGNSRGAPFYMKIYKIKSLWKLNIVQTNICTYVCIYVYALYNILYRIQSRVSRLLVWPFNISLYIARAKLYRLMCIYSQLAKYHLKNKQKKNYMGALGHHRHYHHQLFSGSAARITHICTTRWTNMRWKLSITLFAWCCGSCFIPVCGILWGYFLFNLTNCHKYFTFPFIHFLSNPFYLDWTLTSSL
jgi:hypothetical protein